MTVPSEQPSGGRVPDFFIVGHHKSGTTALYRMLRGHPQIYMPTLKEPKFFASDLPARLEPPVAGRLPATLEQYLALFAEATPEQRAGEASPSYLRSHTAAGLIAELQPHARIIAILREPASFVRSMHLQLVQSHVETEKDLTRALANEEVVRKGQQMRRYSDHVRYVEQLERYRAVFAPEQMLVLIYDDFRADNEATVRKVLRFLDVDDTAPIETIEANPTVEVRSLRMDRMVRGLYAGKSPAARAVKATVQTLMPGETKTRVSQLVRRQLVYGKPQPPDQELMGELRRRFRGEVVALGEYLNRDLLSLWGYGSVD